jgi:hypothetical protein
MLRLLKFPLRKICCWGKEALGEPMPPSSEWLLVILLVQSSSLPWLLPQNLQIRPRFTLLRKQPTFP